MNHRTGNPVSYLDLVEAAAVQATDALRLLFSNTTYTEHGDHFANEEAVSFRHRVSEH